MNEQQYKAVIDALVNYIVRVSEGKETSETEVAVLPEVALALKELTY